MCMSAEVDIVASVVIGGIAVDAFRHIERRDQLLLGTLPALFAFHQAVEVPVWWWADGTLDDSIGRPAMWIYLLVALVALPTWVPLAIRNVERDDRRRRWMEALVAVGVATSGVMLWQLLDGEVDVRAKDWHLQYVFGLDRPVVVITAYLLATCGPLLLASQPTLRWYGVSNAVAVAVIAALSVSAVVSIWCIWAAVTSVAIAWYLRGEQLPSVTLELEPVAPGDR